MPLPLDTKMYDLFRQLHVARSLDYLNGVDMLVEEIDSRTNQKIQNLFGFTDSLSESAVPVKLYIRFSQQVSYDKIRAIQTYVETHYGYSCRLCEWTSPNRLEVTLT